MKRNPTDAPALIDENHWTNPATGISYKAIEREGCEGCAGCLAVGADSPACWDHGRIDHHSVIWIRDDQLPARAPAPVLRLTPPVDAADLARTLVSLRPGKRLSVGVEDGCIVVREADNG